MALAEQTFTEPQQEPLQAADSRFFYDQPASDIRFFTESFVAKNMDLMRGYKNCVYQEQVWAVDSKGEAEHAHITTILDTSKRREGVYRWQAIWSKLTELTVYEVTMNKNETKIAKLDGNGQGKLQIDEYADEDELLSLAVPSIMAWAGSKKAKEDAAKLRDQIDRAEQDFGNLYLHSRDKFTRGKFIKEATKLHERKQHVGFASLAFLKATEELQEDYFYQARLFDLNPESWLDSINVSLPEETQPEPKVDKLLVRGEPLLPSTIELTPGQSKSFKKVINNKEAYKRLADLPKPDPNNEKEKKAYSLLALKKHFAFKDLRAGLASLVGVIPEGTHLIGENAYLKDKTGMYVWRKDSSGKDKYLTLTTVGSYRAAKAVDEAWVNLADDLQTVVKLKRKTLFEKVGHWKEKRFGKLF